MRRAPVGQLQPAPVRMAGRGLPGSQASTQVPEYLRRCTRECPSSSRGRPGPCPRWPRRRRRARRRCARPPARRTTCRSRSRPRPAPAGRVQEQVVRQEQVARQEQAARQVPASPRSRARRPLRPPRLSRAPGQPPARGLGLGRCGRGLGALRRDLGELRADVDRLALVDEDPGDDTRARARHLGVDLVGRDLEQRLVGLDRLALGLQPLDDRSLGDRDAHLRHDDLDDRAGGHQ